MLPRPCPCAVELPACGGQDSKGVWDCPTAAEGGSGCKCWCAEGKSQQLWGNKRKKGGKGYTSPKKRKWLARRKAESEKGDE